MRFARFGFLLFLLFLDVAAKAQVPRVGPPPPLTSAVRDPQALEVLQKTIALMGGSTNIGQIQGVIIQGQLTAAPGALAKDGSFSWEMSGPELRFESTNPSGALVIVSGHGKPAQISGGGIQGLKSHQMRPLFVPALIGWVLFQEFQNEKYSIRFDGLDTLDTVPVEVVTTVAETSYPENVVTPQKWYFQTSTGLPIRVEFRSPNPNLPAVFIQSAFEFSDFRSVSGMLFPFLVKSSISGQSFESFTINSIQLNASVKPADFDGPQGGGM
jgi:hypothetical protein